MSLAASCFFVSEKEQNRPPVSDAERDRMADGLCPECYRSMLPIFFSASYSACKRAAAAARLQAEYDALKKIGSIDR